VGDGARAVIGLVPDAWSWLAGSLLGALARASRADRSTTALCAHYQARPPVAERRPHVWCRDSLVHRAGPPSRYPGVALFGISVYAH
jgi:hypothetical protein